MSDYTDAKTMILNSAVSLFSTKGYKETSVRDISRDTGVNVSMISYYFGGKEGILEKIVNDVTEGLSSYIDRFDLENIEELLVLFQQFLKYLEKMRPHLKILFSEMGKNRDSLLPIKSRIKELQSKLVSFIPISDDRADNLLVERKLQIFTDIILGMIFSDYIFDLSSFQDGINKKEKKIWREERSEMLIKMLMQIVRLESGEMNISSII